MEFNKIIKWIIIDLIIKLPCKAVIYNATVQGELSNVEPKMNQRCRLLLIYPSMSRLRENKRNMRISRDSMENQPAELTEEVPTVKKERLSCLPTLTTSHYNHCFCHFFSALTPWPMSLLGAEVVRQPIWELNTFRAAGRSCGSVQT